MATIPPDDRPPRVFIGDELETLLSDLEYQRATLLWKCAGLDDAQLRHAAVPPSTLNLLALVRHVTGAEQHWFEQVADATEPDWHYGDGDWNDTVVPVDTVMQHYADACDASRRIARQHGFDEEFDSDEFGRVNFRFILVHMIEEYARHCGHADLLRESIDGAVGE
jgi:hypothetical protein